MCEYCRELIVGEWSKLVGEPYPAVELRVTGKPFFDSWHTDEDDSHGVAVVLVPHLFQARGFAAVSLVDDEVSESAGSGFGVHEGVSDSVFGEINSLGDLLAGVGQSLVDLPHGRRDSGFVERRPRVKDSLRDGLGFLGEPWLARRPIHPLLRSDVPRVFYRRRLAPSRDRRSGGA